MNNFILALNFITAMLAAVKQMIATLDEAMPDGTPGQAKLDVVKGWVDQAIAAEQRYAPAAQTIWSLLVPLISAIVAARKAQANAVTKAG